MRKIITLAALCLFLAALLTANRWLTEKIRSVSEEAGAGEGETVLTATADGKADAGRKVPAGWFWTPDTGERILVR